jgi:hypothetical protein
MKRSLVTRKLSWLLLVIVMMMTYPGIVVAGETIPGVLYSKAILRNPTLPSAFKNSISHLV